MKNIRRIGCAMALPSLMVTSAGAAPKVKHPNSERRPNVIFIMMDDAGFGDFSCYGQTKTETPNIDALAANGIRFTDMYTAAPISSPSRCCLLTGVHSGHALIRDNKEAQEGNPKGWDYDEVYQDPSLEGQFPMKAGTPTLGTEMQKAGYKTAMVGKWGVGGPTTESTPWTMGFDFYYGCICQRLAHNYYAPYMWRNNKKEWINKDNIINPGTGLDAGADPRDLRSYEKFSKGKIYTPEVMYDNLIRFVKENQKKPFFLMWTTPLPHSPLQAPQEYVDHYVKKFGDEEPLAGDFFHKNVWPHNYYPCRYPHATYAAMITYFDHQVGELVKELKRLGIYDNTIIIFTSDNGPANNKSSPTVWFESAQPFRCGSGWGKGTLHEGGIRMPFIASWPARIKKGMVSDHIGCFTDIMPTICEAAGAAAPKTDGVSLLPLLSGAAEKQQKHEFLYWEYPAAGGQLAVRWGKWKGIVKKVQTGNRKMQLFDLSVAGKDMESPAMDVATQHPDIVDRMWKYIEQSHVDSENPVFKMKVSRE